MDVIHMALPTLNQISIISSITRFSSSKNLITPKIPTEKYKQEFKNASNGVNNNTSLCLTKRQLKLSITALLLNGCFYKPSFASQDDEDFELDRYTDSNEGFTLLRPSSWIKVDKAGATVLFEEVGEKGNNLGVVVSPVKISRLGEFGTPEFVADKLIQAEKRKESTKDADVVGVSERTGLGGLQVYEFEYNLDSTRGGLKRIFSAAFVASKKLYLLNITHSNKADSPLDAPTRAMLERVLHSFDAAPSA